MMNFLNIDEKKIISYNRKIIWADLKSHVSYLDINKWANHLDKLNKSGKQG